MERLASLKWQLVKYPFILPPTQHLFSHPHTSILIFTSFAKTCTAVVYSGGRWDMSLCHHFLSRPILSPLLYEIACNSDLSDTKEAFSFVEFPVICALFIFVSVVESCSVFTYKHIPSSLYFSSTAITKQNVNKGILIHNVNPLAFSCNLGKKMKLYYIVLE